jgi:uncharacterized protein YcfL
MNKLFPFLLALPLFAGCASSVKTTEPPAPPPTTVQAVTDRRVVIDPSLGGAVRVVGVYTSAGPQGFLRVELRLQNQAQSPTAFTYQFEWKDQNGVTIDLSAPAIPMTLQGRETVPLVAMGPTPLTRDFQVFFYPVK